MNRGRRTVAVVALGAALFIHATASWADLPPAANAGTPDAVKAARAHFTKGRELYQTGAYREAIAELEAARALDPAAKDLVFNLGVIHEKLGEIDDALRLLRLYATMDLDPTELARAETYIKRLEGAKAEVDARRAAASPAPAPPPVRGRIDAVTVAAAAVTVGALGAGAIVGIKALADQPSSSFVIGRDGTQKSLDDAQSSAHTEAVVADICFGGAIAAAAVTLGLYFGRYKDQTATLPPKTSFISIAPLSRAGGGAELLFGGTF